MLRIYARANCFNIIVYIRYVIWDLEIIIPFIKIRIDRKKKSFEWYFLWWFQRVLMKKKEDQATSNPQTKESKLVGWLGLKIFKCIYYVLVELI